MHGHQGGERGQHNGAIRLAVGTAFVQYFHEEGDGGQLAYFAWKKPGEEQFSAIPNEQWLSVRQAGPSLFEAANGRRWRRARVEIESTYWIAGTEDRQATLLKCTDMSRSRGGEIVSREWDFGDGQKATGREASHVFFRLGRAEVTLTVVDKKGNRDTVTIAPRFFRWTRSRGNRKYGEAKDYIAATAEYDPQRMPREDLSLYATFCGNLEQWPQHARAARAYLERFGDARGCRRWRRRRRLRACRRLRMTRTRRRSFCSGRWRG